MPSAKVRSRLCDSGFATLATVPYCRSNSGRLSGLQRSSLHHGGRVKRATRPSWNSSGFCGHILAPFSPRANLGFGSDGWSGGALPSPNRDGASGWLRKLPSRESQPHLGRSGRRESYIAFACASRRGPTAHAYPTAMTEMTGTWAAFEKRGYHLGEAGLTVHHAKDGGTMSDGHYFPFRCQSVLAAISAFLALSHLPHFAFSFPSRAILPSLALKCATAPGYCL